MVPPCIYTLPAEGIVSIKKPLSTMGQGRDRGTTLHYTLMALSVTGTSVLLYLVRSGSSRVIDYRFHAPVFTIHRLSEAGLSAFLSFTACTGFEYDVSIQEDEKIVKRIFKKGLRFMVLGFRLEKNTARGYRWDKVLRGRKVLKWLRVRIPIYMLPH